MVPSGVMAPVKTDDDMSGREREEKEEEQKREEEENCGFCNLGENKNIKI